MPRTLVMYDQIHVALVGGIEALIQLDTNLVSRLHLDWPKSADKTVQCLIN